jgi:hypothetical protein
VSSGGIDRKELMSLGIFNVPLEVLVERTGSDSQMGASNIQLRVPEFIEEIIATMRQMGKLSAIVISLYSGS